MKSNEDNEELSKADDIQAYEYLEENYNFPTSATEARLVTLIELLAEIYAETGAAPTSTQVKNALEALNASTVRPDGKTYYLVSYKCPLLPSHTT